MNCNSVNSTLLNFTLVILAVLVITALLKKKKMKQDKLFFLTLILHIINTAGCLASWVFAGKPGSVTSFLASAGNHITYLFIPLSSTAFMLLIYLSITNSTELKRAVSKVLAVLIGLLGLFLIAIYLSNGWTGWLYSIDEANNFTWGPLSDFLPDGAVLIQIILMYPLLFLETTQSRKRTLLLSTMYLVIPMLSIVLEALGGALMLLYPAQTISMLLIYINAQHEQEKQILEKDLELSNSRIKLLLGQIQPHFIYNTLGTIGELCIEQPKKAAELVQEFSLYLRGNMTEMDNDALIHLSKEIEHVRHYMSIETTRFPDIEICYNLQSGEFMLPALTLQPLVENAVKHGLLGREEGGTIVICSYETDEAYCVTVEDNGVGFEQTKADDTTSHIGIQNIRERIEMMCSGTLTIESIVGKGTKAQITIPKDQ